MDLSLMWPLAAMAYTLAGIASVGLWWAIRQRAPKDRETRYLSASLLFLALHYAGMATDAFLHAGDALPAPFTIWSAVGQTALPLFWMCLCLFLSSVVERMQAPERPSRELIWGMRAANGLICAVALLMLLLVQFDVIHHAPPPAQAAHLAQAMGAMQRIIGLWLIVPSCLFVVLSRRLPKAERFGWVTLVAGQQSQLTSLDLAQYPRRRTYELPDLSRTEFGLLAGIYMPCILLVLIAGLYPDRMWTPPLLGASVLCRLLLLPSLMSIVYYQTRYSFFDVVLKRGVLFVLLAVSVTTATWLVTTHFVAVQGTPQRAAFCVGAVAVVWTSAGLLERGERMLDRAIFHRPDYRVELQSIMEEMGRYTDAERLGAALTARLKRTFRAEFVAYSARVEQPSQLVVRIGTSNRPRGYLSFGARERGGRYRSEDLNFIDAVAGQFSALLESLEARQAERLAATAELKALRAQINPHFLFNALNTVAELACGSPQAERAILNLSRVFRYALESTRRETVALAEEMDAIRSYLEIEQARFEDRLSYEISSAAEELLATPVPPMLIQPLVENAVKHGLAPKPGGGRVTIEAESTALGIRVTVSDDGVGFDPEKTTVNVGLTNVRARVESQGGTWRLESAPGQGTTVSIELKRHESTDCR